MSRTYRRYVLLALTLVCAWNYVDRCVIVLLLQSIKADLQLSDTQLGFLTGLAFSVFYATLGIPLARWADRGNRVTITSVAISLWSVTVMLCLFVTNYVQLVWARVAAGIGESGCIPPTYSLVGDYFPEPVERTRAMTVYWLASPAASLFSFVAGGWLDERYGWRLTLFIIGVPGLVLAMLVKATIREPRGSSLRPAVVAPQPAIGHVLVRLWRVPTLRNLSLGIVLLFAVGSGMAPWYAAFMMRSHGMGTAQVGLWLGLIFGLSGAAGILIGGFLSSHWLRQDERMQTRLSALSTGLLAPWFLVFLLAPARSAALIALIPLSLTFLLFMAPSFALLQRLVPDDMRATTLAVVMLLANLIGMGLGPQLVGVLSDALAPRYGADSLRYAMLAVSSIACWAAYHFWRAGHTLNCDLQGIQ